MTTEALTPSPSAPSLLSLLRVWFGIGLQSFGGGAVTRYLIWQASVERHGWLTDAEFTDYWAIAQIAPGINLLALTVLIGWRVARAGGVAVCLLGLLLPSVAITIALTVIYAQVRGLAGVQSALRGIIPATVGISVLLLWRLAAPLYADSRREGRASMSFSVVVVGAAILLSVYQPIPIFATLILAGVVGALTHWLWARQARRG